MRFLLQVMGVAAMVLILALSLNAQFWADDFFIYNTVREQGVAGFMWMQYHQWDGRFVSLNALVQLNLIRTGSAPLVVGVWSILFLLTAFFVRRIFVAESGLTGKIQRQDALLQVALLFCLMWLGFSGHIAETLYWATGGIYTMSLAMSFGFIWMVMNRPGKISGMWLVGGSVFSLALGLAGVIVSFPLLVFLVLEVILHHKDRRTKGFRLYPMVWGIALAGATLFNVAAPGNYVRAAHLDTSFHWDLITIGVDAMKISLRYVLFSLTAMGMAMLAVFLMPHEAGRMGGRFALYRLAVLARAHQSARGWLQEGKWLMVAFSGIVPMLVIPDFAGGRTAVFFMAYLFLWIWLFFSRLLRREIPGRQPWLLINVRPRWVRGAILLFFVSTITVAAFHFHQSHSIKQQVQARELYLASQVHQADTVGVKPIVVSQIPFSVFFHDLHDTHYARYYGFSYVFVENPTQEALPEYYLNPPW